MGEQSFGDLAVTVSNLERHPTIVNVIIKSAHNVQKYIPSEMMPTDLAMALAVIGWSPVTMMTLMPAERHLATASGTAARGGSIIDIRPTKRSPSTGKLGSSALNLKPTGNLSDGSV